MLLRSKSMPPKILTMLSVAARKHGTHSVAGQRPATLSIMSRRHNHEILET